MKISLVTLSFNQIEYLKEALDSVLGQGYPELEYIVVDPGSKDGSREMIEGRSREIAHTIFEPDRGAPDGLNKGFSRATGEVYGFINSDDMLLPGALERVADYFTKNPKCDIAFGNGYLIDKNGNKTRHYKARAFSVKRYFYGGARWLQQSTFFRSEAFRRSPKFNVGTRTCWDGELFVGMVNRGAVVGYINADLAAFRIHAESITGSGRLDAQYLEDSRKVFEQTFGRAWGPIDDLRRLVYRTTGKFAEMSSH